MKNLAKKLLCLVMAMMLVFAFTACNNDDAAETTKTEDTKAADKTEETKDEEKEDEEKEDKKKSSKKDLEEEEEIEEKKEKKEKKETKKSGDAEEEVTAVVENFFDAVFELDMESALEYTNADSEEALKEIGFGSLSDLTDILAAEDLEGMPEDLKADFVDGMVDILSDCFAKGSYDITDVSEDGDKYIVSVDVEMPDFENIDMDSYMSEEALMEIIADAGVDEESLESMTEDELMEAIMEPMVDYILDAMGSAVEDVELVGDSVDVTVVNVDGEWLIEA